MLYCKQPCQIQHDSRHRIQSQDIFEEFLSFFFSLLILAPPTTPKHRALFKATTCNTTAAIIYLCFLGVMLKEPTPEFEQKTHPSHCPLQQVCITSLAPSLAGEQLLTAFQAEHFFGSSWRCSTK